MFALRADHMLNSSQRENELRFLNTYRPTLKFTEGGRSNKADFISFGSIYWEIL